MEAIRKNARVTVKTADGMVLFDAEVVVLVLQAMVEGRLRIATEFRVFVDGVEQALPPADDGDEEPDDV